MRRPIYMGVGVSLGAVPKVPNGRHQLTDNVTIYVKNGAKHRTAGPAEIHKDGYKAWFQNGMLHRKEKDGPAVEKPDGTKEYWEKGKLIRIDKPKRRRGTNGRK